MIYRVDTEIWVIARTAWRPAAYISPLPGSYFHIYDLHITLETYFSHK